MDRAALVADPPRWLIDTLGPPPVTANDRDRWGIHAERLAAYHNTRDSTDTRDISDTADPLGPRPDDPAQLRAWDLARLSLHEHRRSIDMDQGLNL